MYTPICKQIPLGWYCEIEFKLRDGRGVLSHRLGTEITKKSRRSSARGDGFRRPRPYSLIATIDHDNPRLTTSTLELQVRFYSKIPRFRCQVFPPERSWPHGPQKPPGPLRHCTFLILVPVQATTICRYPSFSKGPFLFVDPLELTCVQLSRSTTSWMNRRQSPSKQRPTLT